MRRGRFTAVPSGLAYLPSGSMRYGAAGTWALRLQPSLDRALRPLVFPCGIFVEEKK